jgi:hypothetical protein
VEEGSFKEPLSNLKKRQHRENMKAAFKCVSSCHAEKRANLISVVLKGHVGVHGWNFRMTKK